MIALTPHGDMDPCPRVEITVDPIPGAETITIAREWEGETGVVRRARRASIGSPHYVVDYEAPLNTPITYVAEIYSAAGALLARESATESVAWDHSTDLAIMQSPLAPRSARTILLDGEAVETLDYVRDVEFAAPLGGGAPFGFASAMGAAQNVPLSLYTRDAAELAAVQQLLVRHSPLLVRCIAPVELPALAYVVFPSAQRRPVHRDRDGWSRWGLVGTLVRPPAAGIAVPVFTYSDVAAMYPGQTYDDVAATRPGATYLDWARDPRP